MGPRAREAIPALLDLANRGADFAAAALWNIDRETNFLIQCISNKLKIRSEFGYQHELDSLYDCVPLPQPLAPLLEEALHHPQPIVRQRAEFFLKKIDPDRLRTIAQDLNEHEDKALNELLKLLRSTNATDQINALMGIRFLGASAATATPLLAELATRAVSFRTNPMEASKCGQSAALACATLTDLGPKAAAAAPALRADLATNGDIQVRMRLAQALASIDPGDTNATAIVQEKERFYVAHPGSNPLGPGLVSSFMWKLGETNPPVDQLVSAVRKMGNQFGIEQLGDIGPLATNALPFLEEKFDPLNPTFGVALAIQKIDPKEAKRLGLPGLLILCPDKY